MNWRVAPLTACRLLLAAYVLTEINLIRRSNIRIQHARHEFQRALIFFRVLRDDAIAGND